MKSSGKRLILRLTAWLRVLVSNSIKHRQIRGHYEKIPQVGNVVVEDNVEIGANTTIDRSTMGSTHVHKGVKLDNLIHLAHNVVVGENTAMAAQVGVSGSTHIGKNCVVGGQREGENWSC